MALPFGSFVAIHLCIGLAILALSILLFALSYCYFPNLYIFFNERIFGIKVTNNSANNGNNDKSQRKDAVGRFLITIGDRKLKGRVNCGNNGCLNCGSNGCLTFVGGVTLAMALMVLFEGCVLGSASIYPGDPCPDDPMTCFVFDGISSVPVSAFDCTPGNISITLSNPGGIWCYGWIIKRNSVSRVMNQIGVCGGIIGVLGTLFGFMFQVHVVVSCLLIIIAVGTFFTMVGLSPSIHVTFSVLAYIVCINCLIIGCTGLIFKMQELNHENQGKIKNNGENPTTGSPDKGATVSGSSNKITPVST